jgi:hypothetical protein
MKCPEFPDRFPSPEMIGATAQEMVQEVVPAGDMIEHIGNLLLFGQGRIFERNDLVVLVFLHGDAKLTPGEQE